MAMCKSKGCGHKKKGKSRLVVGVNDLATTHPAIAAMAHGWDPKALTNGSKQRKQFRCSLGHLPSPVCVYKQVARGADSCAICSKKQILVGFNDLKTTHPDVAARAHGWDPTTFTSGSDSVVQFRCKLGHLPPPTKIYKQVRFGADSCAICSGHKVLPGFNDLKTTHPEIAEMAHGWDPITVSAGSGLYKQFRCSLGHIPKPVPICRQVIYGSKSCAICSGYQVLAGFNDMQTLRPDLAEELIGDATKVTPGTASALRWNCKKCSYKWTATGSNRSWGNGCKKCAKYGFQVAKQSMFYLISDGPRLKFGIAAIDSTRLYIHGLKGWKFLESISLDGESAWTLERSVKKAFKKKGIPLGKFSEKFDGFTESWYRSDLSVKTIKGLCQKLGVPLAA